MQNNLQIVTLSKRWNHHTKSGGYDRLKEEIDSINIHPIQKKNYFFSEDIRRKVLRRIMPSVQNANRYSLKDLAAEIRAIITIKKCNADVLHALYGEDQLNILLKYRNRVHCAMVATYHLPVESYFMKHIVENNVYKKLSVLDAVVVMSNSMISDYENWVGKGKVFFVPHGIDTDTFFPKKIKQTRFSHSLHVLTVGGHGRDWETLRKIVHYFRNNNDVHFRAVSHPKVQEMFNNEPKMKVLTGISEQELIKEYRSADVVFLPVSFATANNSLLEALACGTPVISTDTGGIPDYLDSESGWLLPPGDVRSAVHLIENLIEQRDLIRNKCDDSRKKALQYDWKEITKQTKQVYRFAVNNRKKQKL